MQKLTKITHKKYIELFNSSIIEPEYPEYGVTINRTLYNLLSESDIIRCFDLPKYESGNGRYAIYDHAREYTINLDNFVDREKGDMKFLKINFTTPYNTVHNLKDNIKKYGVDNRFLILIGNPRLYTHCYNTDQPDYNSQPSLTVAHIGKYYKDDDGEKIWNAISQVNDFIHKKTGENLLFTF